MRLFVGVLDFGVSLLDLVFWCLKVQLCVGLAFICNRRGFCACKVNDAVTEGRGKSVLFLFLVLVQTGKWC